MNGNSQQMMPLDLYLFFAAISECFFFQHCGTTLPAVRSPRPAVNTQGLYIYLCTTYA